MNENIIQFIQQQTCASICCVDEQGNPYCFTCFYAFNSEDGLIYFKSSGDTNHSRIMKKNNIVAGTILPDKLNTLVVKGVQFGAEVLQNHSKLTEKASNFYHKKYPFSIAIPGEIWTVRLNNIKMTDSSKVFGKKIDWNRETRPVC